MLSPEDQEDQAQQPSRFWGWALFLWLIGLALLVAGLVKFAHAESMTFTDPLGNSVHLYEEPCYEAPPWLGMRKASMLYQGKPYEACWMVIGHYVLVIDSAGDSTPIPMDVFRKADGA